MPLKTTVVRGGVVRAHRRQTPGNAVSAIKEDEVFVPADWSVEVV